MLQLERAVKHFERYSNSCPLLHDVLTLHGILHQVLIVKIGAVPATTDGGVSFAMNCDRFWVNFQSVNELASELLQSLKQQKVSNPFFQINLAVIIPLFFCGFYCRDWVIRRESLRLLRAWEGAFGGPNSTQSILLRSSALEQVIDIESEGLRPGDVVPESARVRVVHVTATAGFPKMQASCLWSPPAGQE